MKQNKLKFTTIFCLLFTYTGVSYSTIYKWVDEHHQVYYSEKPPPAQHSVTIVTPHVPPSSSAVEAQSVAEKLEAKFSKEKQAALEEREKAEKKEKETALRQANCKQAKATLQTLNMSGRLKYTDANGNTTLLTDEERAIQIERAQAVIKQDCIVPDSSATQ